MTKNPPYAELERRVQVLAAEVARSKRQEGINRCLQEIIAAGGGAATLAELFSTIRQALSAIIDTSSFFIALYNQDRDLLTIPYRVDCRSTASSSCGGKSGGVFLVREVIESRCPQLLDKDEVARRHARAAMTVTREELPESWLGVPLIVGETLVGALVVQRYAEPGYEQAEVESLTAIAAQVALVIECRQAEERLQASAVRFRRIIENVKEISIQGYDENRKVTFWNPASEKIYGYSEEEALGRQLEDLIIPAGMREWVIAGVERWVKEGEAIPAGELVLVDKHGRDVPVYSSHVLIDTAGGKEMFCIDLDLQPIKQAERLLREANAKFHAAMDSLDAFVYVADMETGELLFLNTKTREQSGAEVGDTCWKLLQAGQDGPCHFCTNHLLLDSAGRANPPHVWEFRNTRMDRWYQCRDQAIRWPDGRLVRLEIAVDITERKDVELALRESEARHRTFFNAINDALFVHPYREQGFLPFIEVNDVACRRYGYAREEFLRMTVLDLVGADSPARKDPPGICRRLLAEGQLVFEAVHVKKSGEEFPVEISASIIEQGGEPVILAVARDISERKNSEREREKLEDRLRQAQKLESIGRLAGGVAHDFNNMLGVILGRTEMIMDNLASPHVHEDLREIHKAACRSAELTRQLLAFARKQTVVPQVLDLNDKVADICTMLRRLIGEAIDLVWRPCPDLWPVKMDAGQVDQILTNLCVNARDAIDGAGRIEIELNNFVITPHHELCGQGAAPGQYVALTVTDSGCGMGKEVLDNLFEPFFTTKAVGQGTGLGLATVYGIVRQNNGFVQVKSAPGEGSRFGIYLPRCEPPGQRLTETLLPWLPPKRNVKVLLVEDEPAILIMIESMLRRMGFAVMAADSPKKALEFAERETRIDILLSDIVMPEMDGWQLAEMIAALHPGVCRMLMSGYTEGLDATGMAAEKGVHFIQKPFTRHELSSKLGMIILSG